MGIGRKLTLEAAIVRGCFGKSLERFVDKHLIQGAVSFMEQSNFVPSTTIWK